VPQALGQPAAEGGLMRAQSRALLDAAQQLAASHRRLVRAERAMAGLLCLAGGCFLMTGIWLSGGAMLALGICEGWQARRRRQMAERLLAQERALRELLTVLAARPKRSLAGRSCGNCSARRMRAR
jgi:hypothetical protein